MLKIEHIGIAVKQLSEATSLFEQLLNTPCYKTEEVASEGVNTAFFQLADSKIELLEATRKDSPISRFIDKKGEGIHHLAFEVENIQAEMKRLSALGFEVLNEMLLCFIKKVSYFEISNFIFAVSLSLLTTNASLLYL